MARELQGVVWHRVCSSKNDAKFLARELQGGGRVTLVAVIYIHTP